MVQDNYVVPTDVPDKYNYEKRLNDFDSVRLRTWRSTVPIRFTHGSRQDVGLDLDIPRLTYIPHTFSKLREYFELPKDFKVTLSVVGEDSVVANHLPVGLLYDLFAEMAIEPSNSFLTGRLTLTLLDSVKSPTTPQTRQDLATFVWNSMKQNEYLRRYSIRRVQNLTPDQHERLECAFLNLTLSDYIEASQSLMNVHGLRYIPLRLYLTPTHAVQDLIAPKTEGFTTTLSHAMHKLAPELGKLGADKVNVVLHGVAVDWHMNLVELLDEATYVDGWLYLTVKKAQLKQSSGTASDDVPDPDVVNQEM